MPPSKAPQFTRAQRAAAPAGDKSAGRATDVRVVGAELYFLPVQTRVPLKFGGETLTSVTCARAKVTVEDRSGRRAEGWGETPLNVEWVWPSKTPYAYRHEATQQFCVRLAERWASFSHYGHPFEIGHVFQEQVLGREADEANSGRSDEERLPLLASLLCCSPFDLATYDAYGVLHGVPVFDTLGERYLSHDLARYLEPAEDSGVDFNGRYPDSFLVQSRADSLPAWHLVGGLDPIAPSEIGPDSPDDGHPLLLRDWIERDGLRCLKIKLCGVDFDRDYRRLVDVGRVAQECGVEHLTADFNCTVEDPSYVVHMLDDLARNEPQVYDRILYIEQPFPYDLEANRIDVREVSKRKPLLMDESAHNWRLVRLGRSLGWTGVALKTCKTLTGALLSLCWARAHGMHVMVQDLTNPMLAQIPHLLLAAHTDTLMGVETNAMQFYPSASEPEALVHPGVYRRRDGRVDLSTVRGPGFGYRIDEIARPLPSPAASHAAIASDSASAVPAPHIDTSSHANR